MKMYYESDVNTDALEGKTVAVMGYGSQGRAQSRNMADSGVNVIVGLRENGNSWNLAKEDGMPAVAIGDPNSMFGAIRFFAKAKAEGIKGIIGCDVTIAPQDPSDPNQKPHNLLLICKNNE